MKKFVGKFLKKKTMFLLLVSLWTITFRDLFESTISLFTVDPIEELISKEASFSILPLRTFIFNFPILLPNHY